MIEAVALSISGAMCTIREARWANPLLAISGESWNLNTMSAWRILDREGRLVFGCDEHGERIESLVGLTILSVEPQSIRMGGDPAFKLSDGRWLEIFSSSFGDPWVLRLPGAVFVGDPWAER